MIVRYYPDTLISCYPFVSHVRDISHLTTAEQQDWVRAGKPTKWLVGNMDEDRYQTLIDDIREHGLVNPIVIEYDRQLRVHMGHNRACACRALGIERGPALFVVPAGVADMLPGDPYTNFPVDKSLLSNIRSVWSEVIRARDGKEEVIGQPDAWLESGLVGGLVRSTLDDPNKLQRQRSKLHEA